MIESTGSFVVLLLLVSVRAVLFVVVLVVVVVGRLLFVLALVLLARVLDLPQVTRRTLAATLNDHTARLLVVGYGRRVVAVMVVIGDDGGGGGSGGAVVVRSDVVDENAVGTVGFVEIAFVVVELGFGTAVFADEILGRQTRILVVVAAASDDGLFTVLAAVPRVPTSTVHRPVVSVPRAGPRSGS